MARAQALQETCRGRLLHELNFPPVSTLESTLTVVQMGNSEMPHGGVHNERNSCTTHFRGGMGEHDLEDFGGGGGEGGAEFVRPVCRARVI